MVTEFNKKKKKRFTCNTCCMRVMRADMGAHECVHPDLHPNPHEKLANPVEKAPEELESAERWRYHCEATSSGCQLQVLTTGSNYRFQLQVSTTCFSHCHP